MLLITDHKFLEFLLPSTTIITKSKVYTFLSRWLGTGLLTGTGQKWRKHRRIIGPAFHVQILEKFIDTIDAQSNKLVEKLNNEVGKDSVNIFPCITACALDMICETVMGISINAQDNSDSDYVRSVHKMCSIILDRGMSPVKGYDTLYKLTKTYTEEKEALKILHHATNTVINQRKKQLEESTEDDFSEETPKKKAVFLDLLLQMNLKDEQMSLEDLREEVDTFMFAGHDTTAAALSFCMFNLAKYTDIQAKVYEEQKNIFEDEIYRATTQADLTKMKYLENVIKETLRLYPSVPFYARKVDEDIEYDGKIIPKNVTLLIFAYGLHRKEKYIPEPEKFNPSRYEAMSNKYTYAQIPFSAGPRNCIGQKFAMMEMKIALSNVVRHYELLPAIPEHKLKVAGVTVLRAVNGVNIRLAERKI